MTINQADLLKKLRLITLEAQGLNHKKPFG